MHFGDISNFLFVVLKYLPGFTFIVWYEIWLGPCEVLRLGRSKSGYRKLKKTFTVWDRIIKRDYIKLSKTAVGYQYFFVVMTYLGYVCLLAFIFICLSSIFTHNFAELFRYYIYIKAYVIELPALIFTAFNLCRTKEKGGFEWKFVRNYRESKK